MRVVAVAQGERGGEVEKISREEEVRQKKAQKIPVWKDN
jgi:hypothetical protein